MAQQQLATQALMDDIDAILNPSDDDNSGSVPDYGAMSTEQLKQAFDLEELASTLPNSNPESSAPELHTPEPYDFEPISPEPYVPVIHIPEPRAQQQQQRPRQHTVSKGKQLKPPVTGANRTPITLKLKMPRPPTRPAEPRPIPRAPQPQQQIKLLEIRLISQQPQGTRPDNIYLGSITHPYMWKAIRAGHLYNSILKDTRNFVMSLSPFNKMQNYMKLEIRQPKFTYIGSNGMTVSVSGNQIPRPICDDLPEPISIGAPVAMITLNFVIDVVPTAPKKKLNRKRPSMDYDRDDDTPSRKRSALPPTMNRKVLYQI